MKYMFLVYTKEEQKAQMSEQEMMSVMAGHVAVIETAARAGVLHGVSPLKPTSMATTVKVQNGKTLVVDGPFAETKEQLGGYYIIDCKDLDEAIAWASKIPTSCGGGQGSIEIRPLHEVPEIVQATEGRLAAQHA